jgi:hypothetical protein
VAVHLLLKYYKKQTGLKYEYGGHEDDGEADPVTLDSVIGCANMNFDATQGCYVLAEADQKAFDAFVANERRSRVARGEERNVRFRERTLMQTSIAVAGAQADRVAVETRTGRVASAIARR